MTITPTGRALLVIIALLGLALAVPAASAHGPGPVDEAPPYNATAEEWETWMVDHMGPDGVAWMEEHMGLTVEEMAAYMADGEGWYHHGPGGYGPAGYHHGPAGYHHGPGGYGPAGSGGYGYCH